MRRAVAGPGEGFTARDWVVILQRVRREAKEDNLGLIAAGVAFWAILSIVPLLVGVMAVAAVITGPAQIRSQLGPLAGILPRPVARSLTGQLSDAAAAMSGQGRTLGLIIGLLGVLWTCSRGIGAVISGLHVVIDENETRGVIRRRATAFSLAAGALAAVMGALALVAAVPHLALRNADLVLGFGIRCALLAVLAVVGLILLYRYGPDRANADWHEVRWGAGFAMTCWLLMSIALGVYVAGTGGRSSTYGTLAGAAAIATWLYMSSYIVLLGAEINAEIERLLAHRSAFRDTPAAPATAEVLAPQEGPLPPAEPPHNPGDTPARPATAKAPAPQEDPNPPAEPSHGPSDTPVTPATAEVPAPQEGPLPPAEPPHSPGDTPAAPATAKAPAPQENPNPPAEPPHGPSDEPVVRA